MGSYELFKVGDNLFHNLTWELVSHEPRYASWRWERAKELSIVHRDEPLPSAVEIKAAWAQIEDDIYNAAFDPVREEAFRIIKPFAVHSDGTMKPESLGLVEQVLQSFPNTAILRCCRTACGYLFWVPWQEPDLNSCSWVEMYKLKDVAKAQKLLGELKQVNRWDWDDEFAHVKSAYTL